MNVRLVAVLLLGHACAAQSFCQNAGSVPMPASWSASPLTLGCTFAPTWPMWRLFTPQHRAPAPHFGHRQGRSEAVPAIVVHYRCTGLLLSPVIATSHANLGYVVDMPEHVCN